MQKYKDENIFNSKVMKELLTDTFDYKGSKPNTVLVKDAKTGKPVELKVFFARSLNSSENKSRKKEHWQLLDKKCNLIAENIYFVDKDANGKLSMTSCYIENYNKDYIGAGFRLEQLHIERAIQLGLDRIHRTSKAEALPFNTKMGFLPIQTTLTKIESIKDLLHLTKECFSLGNAGIPIKNFNPIIIEKNGEFFIDVNKTQAKTTLDFCKEKMKQFNKQRVKNINVRTIETILKDKEFEKWQNIMQKQSILSKLDYKLPTYN